MVPVGSCSIDVSQNKRQVICYPLRAKEYFTIWHREALLIKIGMQFKSLVAGIIWALWSLEPM